MLALEDLFLCLGRRSTEQGKQLFARLLWDIDGPMLAEGLSKAMMTAKDWMTPAAIREICLGGSQADLDAAAADEAWNWVLKFIKDHTAHGRPKPGPIIADVDGEYVYGPDVPPPPTPDNIRAALTAIGGDRLLGCLKIANATNTELVFIKKDFAAAYGRARRLG